MPNRIPRTLAQVAGATLLVVTASASAITIDFDYTYDSTNFFADQVRKDILNDAGSFFSTHLTDDLDVITSSGVNHFNARFNRPDDGTQITLNDYDVAADTLVVFVGARDLGGSTLGRGGPGGWTASGTAAFLDAVGKRGEGADTSGAGATETAPWGGTLAFDSVGTNWYFDGDTSSDEAFAGSDFFSVVLHELAHVLGVGIADSWDNLINLSDEFTGIAATAIFGSNPPVLADGSHWAEGTTSTVFGGGGGASQEAAMDPTLTTGTRKRMTDLDMAGLDDLGWDVSAFGPSNSVPLPSSALLLLAGLMGVRRAARRR